MGSLFLIIIWDHYFLFFIIFFNIENFVSRLHQELRLRILGNQGLLENSQNCVEPQSSIKSSLLRGVLTTVPKTIADRVIIVFCFDLNSWFFSYSQNILHRIVGYFAFLFLRFKQFLDNFRPTLYANCYHPAGQLSKRLVLYDFNDFLELKHASDVFYTNFLLPVGMKYFYISFIKYCYFELCMDVNVANSFIYCCNMSAKPCICDSLCFSVEILNREKQNLSPE